MARWGPVWREVACHPLSLGPQDRTHACPCPSTQVGLGGGSRPRLCLPPPLCVPAPQGHGLNSIIILQCPSTVIATREPGVEGAALPHDGDEAEAGAVLGVCGRRGLPPPRPARLFPPPARGRRLLSALPEEVQHPAGSGRGSLLSPIPGPGRGLPTPGSSRPPPGRSPSPVQDQTAPFLWAQTPPGEAGRAGGGGALLLGGPGRPAVPAGLGPGPGRAAAPGAVHGGGAVRGGPLPTALPLPRQQKQRPRAPRHAIGRLAAPLAPPRPMGGPAAEAAPRPAAPAASPPFPSSACKREDEFLISSASARSVN